MTESSIHAITMPKWGLAMTEGKVAEWLVVVGDTVAAGDEIATVETSKITGPVESHEGGVFRKVVSDIGTVLPIGALMGILAPESVSDVEIETFVGQFLETFVPPETSEDSDAGNVSSLDIDGGPLAYFSLTSANESATPAVLIHGFSGDSTTWMLTSSAIAETRPVYAFELPGHGASTKTIADGSPDALAKVIANGMQALGIDRAHIVGHSLGGAVAMALTQQHPDRAASLSLLAPCGLGPDINVDFIEGMIAAERRKEMKLLLEQLFADASVVTRDMVNEMLKFKRLDGVNEALRTITSGFIAEGQQSADYRDVLSTPDLATLILWGANDQIVHSKHSADLPQHVRVELLQNVGHMPMMEAATKVNETLIHHFTSADG